MKPLIAPSILSFDHSRMHEVIACMADAGADVIHFDVMDGQFVPPITFGDGLVRAVRGLADIKFEAHLMTLTPERHFEAFAKAGCQRIIFHQEVAPHAHRLCQQLHDHGLEAAIAINPGTCVETVLPLLDVLDGVLVMTVNPGWGGQEFIASAMPKVRRLRQERPDLDIEVDGGIDPITVGTAWTAGANLFVVGTYLMRAESVKQGIQQVKERCV